MNGRHREPRVAVVGAGIAGLACARLLTEQSLGVTVFDRGRGPGGRLSTRRLAGRGGDERAFDHGAPGFLVSDARFARQVRSWIADGVCGRWDARVVEWQDGVLRPVAGRGDLFVGVPRMSAVCRHLAEGLDLQTEAIVRDLTPRDGFWSLTVERAATEMSVESPFDAVVVAAPPPQAARLVTGHSNPIRRALASVEMRPAWVAMLVMRDRLHDLPDVIEVDGHAVIERLIRDDSKPGRRVDEKCSRWVVHAKAGWSAERYDSPREQIEPELVRETLSLMGQIAGHTLETGQVERAVAHRWGLAEPAASRPERCLADPDTRLVVCGDAFRGPGVEAAFLSGRAAARLVRGWRAPARARG